MTDKQTGRATNSSSNCRQCRRRCVSPCPMLLNHCCNDYCCRGGVVDGVAAGAAGFDIRCRRGRRMPPPVVNIIFSGSPGTLISVRLVPTFFARSEWAGSEEHTSELQSPTNLVCRLLLEKK